MSESKKLIPRRRFKEFEGAECWQSFELGKITNYIKGYAFNSCDYQSYGVRIIRVSDLSSDKIKNNNECIYIAVNKAKIYDKYSIQKFDIIITTVGSKSELKESAVGRPIMINESKDYLLNQNLVKISPQNNLSSYFLYCQLLQPKYTNYIAVIERGNANQANIALNDLWMYQCNIPSILEQDMLATFFKKLDNLINTQQKKLEKAKTLKSAYLREMFPNEGELKPKRRFLSFKYNWKEFKIKELFTITRGKVLASNQVSMNRTYLYQYPVYSSQTKNNGLMGYYKEFLFENAITWTTDGANAGTVNYRESKFYSTNVNGVLLSSDGFANKAIAEMLNTIAWKYVSKVGNPKLMNVVMAEIPILIPNTAEQTKIGNFFKLLDNKIALEQKKLAKLKNIKQAYLNEMFV